MYKLQILAFLKLDKRYLKILHHAKQLSIKTSCTAREVVSERSAIHKLNALFFLEKIESECKY